MGRKGDGIDVRDAGIRVRFTWEGERQRQTLRINGKPLAPTVANIKYARRMVVEINQKIRDGIFSMAEYFPATGDAGALTVANQLDTWLDTQRERAEYQERLPGSDQLLECINRRESAARSAAQPHTQGARCAP